MNDSKDKTANKDHQVERTVSKDDDYSIDQPAATSSEYEITQNKPIAKNKSSEEAIDVSISSPPSQEQAVDEPDTFNPEEYEQSMPGLDGPTRLQNADDFSDLKNSNPLNQAMAKSKNFSAEFAQGFASIPKKIITAYQGYAGEDTSSSFLKQFGLVILACLIFYFWNLFRSPTLKNSNVLPSASKELMVDIIELYSKGEKRKAKILINKAAELEEDQQLSDRLKAIKK